MIYSAIHIGSTAVGIKIASDANNRFRAIDETLTPLEIGKEVYFQESVSHKTVRKLTDILKSYRQMLTEYRVDRVRVIATGAIAYAKNVLQLIEIIRMQTGFEVDILENPVENYLTYKALKYRLPDYDKMRQSSVIVDIHSGSTDITVYNKGRLVSNDTVKIGSREITPYIEKVMSMANDYPKVIADYITSFTRRTQKKIVQRDIRYLLILGADALEMSRLFFDGAAEIPAEDFWNIERKIMEKNYDFEKKAGSCWESMLFCFILCGIFLQASDAKIICFPNISLSDGVISHLIETANSQKDEEDIFDAATEIAKKFKCKLKHIRNLESNTLILYEALSDLLDLDDSDSFLLRLSCNIAEIGKSLKRSGYERASYDMLKHLDIFGVSRKEMENIGQIVLETEHIFSDDVTQIVHTVKTRKIAILLAIGMALDINNLQHIRIERVKIGNEEVTVEISGSDFTSSLIALEPVQKAFLDGIGYKLVVEDLCY